MAIATFGCMYLAPRVPSVIALFQGVPARELKTSKVAFESPSRLQGLLASTTGADPLGAQTWVPPPVHRQHPNSKDLNRVTQPPVLDTKPHTHPYPNPMSPTSITPITALVLFAIPAIIVALRMAKHTAPSQGTLSVAMLTTTASKEDCQKTTLDTEEAMLNLTTIPMSSEAQRPSNDSESPSPVLPMDDTVTPDTAGDKAEPSKAIQLPAMQGASVITLAETEGQQESDLEYLGWRVGLLLISGICATNYPLIKLLETSYGGSEVGAVRFPLALLPVLPALLTEVKGIFRGDEKNIAHLKAGMDIGAWCVLGYITQAIGLDMTTAAKGSFIIQGIMLAVTPTANSLNGVNVPIQTWISVVVALIGTAVLEGVADLVVGGQMTIDTGDYWCVLAATGFGLMLSRMEAHIRRLGNAPETVSALTVWQLAPLAAAFVTWAAIDSTNGVQFTLGSTYMDQLPGTELPLTALMCLLWMAFISTAFVLSAQTSVMKHVPSAEAGVILSTEPLFAAIYAMFILGDQLDANEAMGGAIILVACLVAQWDIKATFGWDKK